MPRLTQVVAYGQRPLCAQLFIGRLIAPRISKAEERDAVIAERRRLPRKFGKSLFVGCADYRAPGREIYGRFFSDHILLALDDSLPELGELLGRACLCGNRGAPVLFLEANMLCSNRLPLHIAVDSE